MSTTDVEIDRVLHALTAALNDQKLEVYDQDRVQEIVDESVGGEHRFTADPGGGLHDETGRRIGAIRKTDSGEWIVDRQNPTAENSDAAIPKPGPQSFLRKVLSRAKALSG